MQKNGWLAALLAALWLLPTAAFGEMELVSRSVFGEVGNGVSSEPAISADGRFVAFTSDASNLVPGDPGSWYWQTDPDVFILDRNDNSVENASRALNSTGAWFIKTVCQQPTLDGRGEQAAFACFSGYHLAYNMQFDIYAYDRRSAGLKLVTLGIGGQKANGSSSGPRFSADGTTLAFTSTASNLLSDDPDSLSDVYLFDLKNGTFDLASLSAAGVKGDGPSSAARLSADGRFVAFVSAAANLVPGDDNNVADIFLRDRREGTLQRFVAPDGGAGAEPTLSSDASRLAFSALAGDGRSRIYLAERFGTPRLVADGSEPALSADGRYLAYVTPLAGVPGASVVERRDLEGNSLEVVSVTSAGQAGSGIASAPALSAHGAEVVLASTAADLVPEDSNGVADIFLSTAIADITPPTLSLRLSTTLLWPPNKKSVAVQVDGAASDDRELANVEITVSDEYGSMVDQIVPGFGSTIWLEAWRDGNDLDGRIYTVTAIAIDAAGNRTEERAQVLVPHDQRPVPALPRR